VVIFCGGLNSSIADANGTVKDVVRSEFLPFHMGRLGNLQTTKL